MKTEGNKNRGTYESSGYNATKAIGKKIDEERRNPDKSKKINGVGRTEWYLGQLKPAEVEKYIKSGKKTASSRAEGGANIYRQYKAKAAVDIGLREAARRRAAKRK